MNGSPAYSLDQNDVNHNLHDDVQEMNVGKWQLHYKHWTQCVEQDLERSKESFASDIAKHNGLELGRQVSIEFSMTEEFVVEQMVRAETSGIRDSDGQVSKNGIQFVVNGLLERQVVRHFMNRQEHVVGTCCTDNVCRSPESPRQEGLVTKEISHGELQANDTCHDPLGQRFRSAELGDMRVGLNNLAASRAMRFFLIRPIELIGYLSGDLFISSRSGSFRFDGRHFRLIS